MSETVKNNPVKIVVAGYGMTCHKFCEKLLAKKQDRAFEVVVFGEEPRPAYDRVHLSAFFDGKTADDLTLEPAGWYAENGIRLHLSDPVMRIDTASKTVISHSGRAENYDCLVLATGSAAFVPTLPGTDKRGVFVYRSIEDLEMIRDYAPKVKSAAVLGGGLLGLEAAKALLDLGIPQAHVVEFAPRLMPRQVDDAGSRTLQHKLEALGLQIHLNKSTSNIRGNGRMEGMEFTDGSSLNVEMLVISAGIKPRDEVAKAAGIATEPRGGIVVSDQMQTSDPAVFAIGECALRDGMIYGLVVPCFEMAEVLASNLCGGEKNVQRFRHEHQAQAHRRGRCQFRRPLRLVAGLPHGRL